MIIPADVTLECFISGTFSQAFIFYSDDAETQPFDLTGWTPAFKVTLATGQTITGTAAVTAPGTIQIGLSSTQTTGLDEQDAELAVSITQDGTSPLVREFLIRGTLEIRG